MKIVGRLGMNPVPYIQPHKPPCREESPNRRQIFLIEISGCETVDEKNGIGKRGTGNCPIHFIVGTVDRIQINLPHESLVSPMKVFHEELPRGGAGNLWCE